MLIGFLLAKKYDQAQKKTINKYEYLNQNFQTDIKYALRKSSLSFFRDQLMQFIESERGAGRISDASVFFRDLQAGPTFEIKAFANFSPASLLKLPLAVAYFVLEEQAAGVLKTRLQYVKGGDSMPQEFVASKSLKENSVYSVEELLFDMIVYSDNISQNILTQYIKTIPNGENTLAQVFQEVGATDTTDVLKENINASGYASMFRQLYNVSYLNAEFSEKILSWLAQSDFKDGLVAGVPDSIGVAHKFGERVFSTDIEVKQLHDCGIVYFPDNPYLLCVMTRGGEWDNLSGFIKAISEKVYKEMESRRI